MDIDTYLTARLDDQIAYYEAAAGRAKRRHLRLQTGILVLSALVPVLVELPFSLSPGLRLVVALFSLLVTILTGLANLRKDGELWLSYRTMGELLKSERFLFLTGSGRYREAPARFATLVEAVEALLSSEHTRFRAAFAQTRQEAEGAGAAQKPVDGAAAEAGRPAPPTISSPACR